MRERWLLPQVGAITPQYIEMTLRGALAGAHIPQWELFNLMEDTWPRLRKNVLELKMAVRNRRAVFEAYRDEDEEESPTATERMKLVSAALRTMQPDPAVDEGAFDEMVGDILDAWFKGVSVLEIDWQVAQTRALGRFVAPRAARWVSPVSYAWDGDLRLGLDAAGVVAGVTDPGLPRRTTDSRRPASGVIDPGDNGYNGAGALLPFPADRFLVAKCKTKSGSVLGGALLRPAGLVVGARPISPRLALELRPGLRPAATLGQLRRHRPARDRGSHLRDVTKHGQRQLGRLPQWHDAGGQGGRTEKRPRHAAR